MTGGGARGAYQAGVLKRIGEIKRVQTRGNPFPIIGGSSAGAINGSALAVGSDDLSTATTSGGGSGSVRKASASSVARARHRRHARDVARRADRDVVPLLESGHLAVLHESHLGHITVLDADKPTREAARSVRGFLAGLAEQGGVSDAHADQADGVDRAVRSGAGASAGCSPSRGGSHASNGNPAAAASTAATPTAATPATAPTPAAAPAAPAAPSRRARALT